MATHDSGINCFNCGNFNASRFSLDRRSCEIHNFSMPDVDVELVCGDFRTVNPLSVKEGQLLQQIGNPGTLYYHLYPYVVEVYEFSKFENLQTPSFSSECLSSFDIVASREMTGLAIDLTKSFRLWERANKRSEALLLLEKEEYPASIFLADYKYGSDITKKLVLYSEKAQNHLQSIFEERNRSHPTVSGALSKLGFTKISMDFTHICFFRNDIIRNM